MTQITETLHNDHEKVEKIFEKLRETGDGAEKTRLDLCRKLKEELTSHTEFEEEVFYPALRKTGGDASGLVDTAIKEHREVDDLLEKLEGMDPTSKDFMETVGKLEKSVQDHVHREESELFPIAKASIERDQSEEMSERHDQMAK